MLQTSYATQEAIPENQRGAYVQRDGKWVLDDLSNDHPVVAKRDELLTKTSTQQGQITRLTNEKSALEQNVLPAGHKAVPEADAALIEVVKPLGDAKAVKEVVEEHKTLKAAEETRAADELFERAAKELGYENVASFKAVAKALKLDVRFKTEKVDGKEVEKPYVGDKPLADHVAATPELKDAEPVFRVKPQAAPPSTEAGAGTRPPATEGDKGGGDKSQSYRFQDPGDVEW
jgi:hypothetical protein